MRIILTHEQADFDAVASLLGAYLLDEDVVPVMPRRMNRNIGAYLTIYGAELPFVEARDLDNEPIDYVTLVDTQSMVSVRGVGPLTRINVVDHHPLREDTPSNWQISIEPVGATTTVLVEGLQEKTEPLLASHATLLLLGIYEDTGSLTFSRTTSRDLQAAAYLLEQGANLRIASDFLNHPLSSAQQELYELLRKSAEMREIHGHRVAIATGDARQLDEELSTLTHKLDDMLDPEALFMLVETKSGVQLIARSSSDHIDVAEITSRFGGGGHDRAAAALVRNRDLQQLKTDLIQALEEIVTPAITVAQIMSFGLQMFHPDMPVGEAADRMQRFGYEGYPVVRNGQVIGLLTRRSVDRAVTHKLNTTAEKLMNAGSYIVHPEDSIESLQRLMSDSGWGQIPVVDRDKGEIIGIVTRTDLLKVLSAGKDAMVGRRNLASKLEKALPTARLELLKAVAEVAYTQHLPIYIVGGFVRDLLLDRPGLDFDIVVEGDAIALARSLVKKFGGSLKTHGRFGTAKWYLKGFRRHLLIPANDENSSPSKIDEGKAKEFPEFLDLITARTEFYTYPSALPTVERGSIKLDLHRRDFTINTLALRIDGHHFGDLYDFWGGLNDLNLSLVRVLHSLSFVDDPTRMLRAVRFEQRFGFEIESRTLQLLTEALSLMTRVSGDRIHHELDHILDEPHGDRMISRLEELELLEAIHPDLVYDPWFQDHLDKVPLSRPSGYWLPVNVHDWDHLSWLEFRRILIYGLWLVRLEPDKVQSVGERIKHPAKQLNELVAASKLRRSSSEMIGLKPSRITGLLDEYAINSIAIVYLGTEDEQVKEILRDYSESYRFIHSELNGNDLRACGLSPGPVYRQILNQLRAGWLDGEITSAEQEKELFDLLVKQALNQS